MHVDRDRPTRNDADLHFDDYANAHLNAEPDTICDSHFHVNAAAPDAHRYQPQPHTHPVTHPHAHDVARTRLPA